MYCAPWCEGEGDLFFLGNSPAPTMISRNGAASNSLIDYRNTLHNQLLKEMALQRRVYVQECSIYLATRFDAHMSGRGGTF